MARPALKQAFIQQHLHLQNKEIAALAGAVKVGITDEKQVSAARYALKKKGITASTKTTAIVPHSAAKNAVTAKVVKPVKRKPAQPQKSPKEALFKKLIFELGWDRVQPILAEFQEFHHAMGG